jgi:hypothetical protein
MRSDFSGDGIDDILWYNRLTDRVGYYDMERNGTFTWREFDDPVPSDIWPWVEIGVYNGATTRSDILFLDWSNNGRSNYSKYWDFTSATTYTEYDFPDTNNKGAYQYIPVEGNLDLTNDGYDDVLYMMSGGQGAFNNSNYRYLYAIDKRDGSDQYDTLEIGYLDPEFDIIYSGDFDGDMHDDLLLQNTETGYLGFLDSGENFNFVGVGMGSNEAAGDQWQVFGTGDFTNDMNDDILWYNRANNAVGLWDMQGGGWTGWIGLGQGGEGWFVQAVGDYTGDNYDDILWRNNTTGATGIWDVNSEGGVEWIALGSPSWDWDIVQA